MKTKAKWLLNLVKGFLDVVWYFHMIVIGLALVILTIVYLKSNYTDISAEVKYKVPPAATNVKALTTQVSTVTIQGDQSLVKMSVRVTTEVVIISYLLIFMFEALVLTILYNLRKVFGSLKRRQPFVYDNVRRLKLTALGFALFTPLQLLFGILNYAAFTQQIPGFSDHYMLVWSDIFIGVILGAIIYIVADIFSYGFELKKENEEFV